MRAMDAKLVVNGIEIIVPVSALGEAMRQLQPFQAKAPTPAPAPKPASRVMANDIDIDVMAVLSPPPLMRPTLCIAFLKLLQDHEVSGGVSPDEVQKVLGAEHPKGIGSKMAGINALLKHLGYASAEVYSNDQRDSEGRRVWKVGPKLRDALGALQQEYAQPPKQ